MFKSNMVGIPTRVTAAGLTCISSANTNLIGVLCCNSATATGGVALYHGVTASASVCGLIVFASGSVGQFISVPAYCSGGLTINVGVADNPDITLFWNPV